MSEFIVTVTPENAQQVIIDGSASQLVVVDFWADWCAPCKALMPILEKLAVEYAGQFVLAKINADEQQALATQFGIRSLPTVMFIKDGQPIDGFTGAETEQSIRALLDKHLPKPWAYDFTQALALQEASQHSEAIELLRKVHRESGQAHEITLALAHSLIALNHLEQAQGLLDTIKMADQDSQYQQLIAQLELKKEAALSPELVALEEEYQKNPDQLEVAYQFAIKLSEEKQYQKSLEVLLAVLQKDLNFGEAKKAFLDIIAALGKGDPIAISFQKRFFTLLY